MRKSLYFLYCFKLGYTSRTDSGLGTCRTDNLIVTEETHGLWSSLCWLQAPALLKPSHPESYRGGEGQGLREPWQQQRGSRAIPQPMLKFFPPTRSMCQWSLPLWEGSRAQGAGTVGAVSGSPALPPFSLQAPCSILPLPDPQNQEQSLWATALPTQGES